MDKKKKRPRVITATYAAAEAKVMQEGQTDREKSAVSNPAEPFPGFEKVFSMRHLLNLPE
jgi:hypothetical protein